MTAPSSGRRAHSPRGFAGYRRRAYLNRSGAPSRSLRVDADPVVPPRRRRRGAERPGYRVSIAEAMMRAMSLDAVGVRGWFPSPRVETPRGSSPPRGTDQSEGRPPQHTERPERGGGRRDGVRPRGQTAELASRAPSARSRGASAREAVGMCSNLRGVRKTIPRPTAAAAKMPRSTRCTAR